MSPENTDVVVVGGGIAGLTCAWRLHRAGREALVLEQAPESGGNTRTSVEGGYRLERGPHTFMASARAVFDLVEALGLEDALVPTRPEATARFIARRGRLHPVPTGPLSFLTTSLLSLKGKLALAAEPWRNERGEPNDTAAQFFDRRFGREAARVLAGAFVSGVYAGDPSLLSAPAAFPLFWRFEQESGSMIRGAMKHRREQRRADEAAGRTPRKGLFSFTEGMGQLPAALAAALGDRCRTGVEVRAVEAASEGFRTITAAGEVRSRSVVVATPPKVASGLLRGLDEELSTLLLGVPLAPVAVVYLGYGRRCPPIPDGFGFLVPRGEGLRTLGVLFPSRLFDGRAPDGGDLLTAYIGGMTDPDALDLADDELEGIVRSELADLTGLDSEPEHVRVRRYEAAIPQLVLGHLERVEGVKRRLAAVPGLVLAGNYLKGVGVKDAVASGDEAAEAVLAPAVAESG